MKAKTNTYIMHLQQVMSRPQKKHFLVYLSGLLMLIKFRSIREIARHYGAHNTDGLQHFITNSHNSTEPLEQANRHWIAQQARHQPVELILDDTPCPREGPKIEGLGLHHGSNGLVKGLCAVTAIVRSGNRQWAWSIRGYWSKKSVAKQQFRSKIQIALEILDQAKPLLKQPVTVLLDSWYTCAPMLQRILQAQWIFVAAIKTNRILYVNDRKTKVRHLAKGPRAYQSIRASKKRVFRVAKRRVHLPKVGEVALFICKHHNTTRFFVSNDLKLTARKMVLLYSKRFEIEFFHKDIKQHLGFGELFVRSRHGVQKHWTLVAIAYNLVCLSTKDSFRSFRQRIEHLRLNLEPSALTALAT